VAAASGCASVKAISTDLLVYPPDAVNQGNVPSSDPYVAYILMDVSWRAYSRHMENFDVVQALVRTALAGNHAAVVQQVTRLADRLADSHDESEARALRSLVTRSKSRQAVEPLNLQPSDSPVSSTAAQRIGPRTALPVDRETGAPLCSLIMPGSGATLPVLPEQAQAAFSSLVREWTHEAELARLALSVSRSLLIYGPPGTGKTTLALAISARLGRPAVVARLDGLISSLLGNTARNLGALFDFCNRYDCVLILDEFDAVAKIRDDSNEIGEIKRVVNALLQNLDKRTHFGLTIAVTNHEHLLDSAIWRRFEHQIHLGLPDFESRAEIALSLVESRSDADALASTIAYVTEGRSGSDVRSLALAFLKASVLSADADPAPIELLRSTAHATGAKGVEGLFGDDKELAKSLHESVPNMTQQDLADVFGKDRRTIARWMSIHDLVAT